jgi:thiamine-phosphate pyrophosphorylase
VLITGALCVHHGWERVAELAIEGGADCLQLREKSLTDRELLTRARRLVAIARAAPSRPAVIVNDRADVALLAGADGVHLGQDDLPATEARRLAGSALLIGVSTAGLDQARSAARDGADYAGVGPMFTSSTKAKPTLAGVAYLRAYLDDGVAARLPHLAISGITPENIEGLRRAGCLGAAVSGAVCGSPDPRGACAALLRGAIDARARGAGPTL